MLIVHNLLILQYSNYLLGQAIYSKNEREKIAKYEDRRYRIL